MRARPNPFAGRVITVERRHSRWVAEEVRLVVLRVTNHALVARAPDGTEAWFDRATGGGQRGGNGRAAARSSDWTGWRLVYRDRSDLWAEHPGWEEPRESHIWVWSKGGAR